LPDGGGEISNDATEVNSAFVRSPITSSLKFPRAASALNPVGSLNVTINVKGSNHSAE